MSAFRDLPDFAIKILNDRGFNYMTHTFNDVKINDMYKQNIKAYKRGKEFYGTRMGNLIIIGYDVNLKMADYVASKDNINPTITDEEYKAFEWSPQRFLAFCLSCNTFCYPRPANMYKGNAKNCSCRGGNIPVKAIPTIVKGDTISYTRAYKICKGMIDRCYNPESIDYPLYGAQGITICKEWYNPELPLNENATNFANWAYDHGFYEQDRETTPNAELLTIDRIDPYGNYEPNNCRFIRKGDQVYNRKISKKTSFNSPTEGFLFGNVHDMIKKYHKEELDDSSMARIYSRLNVGWDPYDAFTIPSRYTRAKEGCTPLPRDPSTYRDLYDGPRYNDKGELRDKDGFLVLDWKIDIRKKYKKDTKILSRNKSGKVTVNNLALDDNSLL